MIPILLGSESDKEFASKITAELSKWGVKYEVLVASAHKVPEKVMEIVRKYNESDEPVCYITVAGRSNGLSGVTAGSSVHPVIACPPFSSKEDYMVNIHSTLQMPSDTPVLTVIEPKNAALSAVRILANQDPELKKKVRDYIKDIKASFN
ncbi:MAG: AIR carboxylase family protein [Patescibacteria group bacterium]|nr:AIR carboxylase family protein [Patescibacteria group bacterium]